MKKIRLFIPLILSSTVFLFAQTTTPVPVQISEHIENIDGKYYHLHVVERGQTLFSISRAYQVAVDQIKRTILDKPDIQIGETLQIPANSRRIKQRPVDFSGEPEQKLESETKYSDTVQKMFNNPQKSVLNVALMLPLFLNDIDQIRVTPRTNRASIRPFSFISFYEGAMLAAQAFECENVKINVHVFDVTEDTNSAIRLIRTDRLRDMDIIVGPLFSQSFRLMSNFAKEQRIFIVNPLSDRSEILDNNPFVIKINPSEKSQLQILLEHVAETCVGQRILVVSNDSLPNERGFARHAKLFFEKMENRFDTVIFLDIRRDRFQRLQSNLSTTKNNAIVFLSNDDAFVTSILTRTPRHEHASNTLFSLQRSSRFEVTDPVYLNNLQTHYIDPFFINHDNESVKIFDQLFFETFQTLPSPLAYRGFDVMSFVFQLLKIGNTNYGNYVETFIHKGFHNHIRLQRENPRQGLENQQTNILRIKDSKLRKVNN